MHSAPGHGAGAGRSESGAASAGLRDGWERAAYVLGVPVDADLAVVRAAWRRVARALHPDTGAGRGVEAAAILGRLAAVRVVQAAAAAGASQVVPPSGFTVWQPARETVGGHGASGVCTGVGAGEGVGVAGGPAVGEAFAQMRAAYELLVQSAPLRVAALEVAARPHPVGAAAADGSEPAAGLRREGPFTTSVRPVSWPVGSPARSPAAPGASARSTAATGTGMPAPTAAAADAAGGRHGWPVGTVAGNTAVASSSTRHGGVTAPSAASGAGMVGAWLTGEPGYRAQVDVYA